MEPSALIQKLSARLELTERDIEAAVQGLMCDRWTEGDKIQFLETLAAKGETAREIATFARQLRELAVPVRVSNRIVESIDVCGTGADRAHTFNVSSTVMFIVAAAGIAVAKHGNRSITSQCGSADVLEALGVKIDMNSDRAAECLEAVGVAFFFAPAYHKSFKAIAGVRKTLAERQVRTIFNYLGPLINPARPTAQLVGIFTREMTAKYAEVLQLMGLQRAMVVHGLIDGSDAGLDEMSTVGPTIVSSFNVGESVKTETIDARSLGIERRQLHELRGENAQENAQILREILSNRGTAPARELVLLNASAALVVAGKCRSFAEGLQLGEELLRSGSALRKLEQLIEFSRSSSD